ncbi:MAG: phytoene desaturase family protein [Desertimonas sp.]
MTFAAVVGSGPNGLAAAIRLARAGVAVTVFEAAERAGGGATSSVMAPSGVVRDHGSAAHPSAIASPFFSTLDLARHGLRWRWADIDLAHPLDDGSVAVATRDLDATAASLGEDAARWCRLFGPLARHADELVDDVFRPVLHVPRHLAGFARFGLAALLPATAVARRFAGERATALFVGAAAHKFGRLSTPLSSGPGLLLLALAHVVGWPVAEGGSEAITRALVAELTEAGGGVRTATTIRSLPQLNELMGVVPDIVMFDTAPAGALAIIGDRLPARMRRRLRRYRHGPAAYKLDLVVDGGIPWVNAECARAGTLHLGGSGREIAAAEAATVRGRMPERPFVLVGQQYVADPGRACGSLKPVYAYAHVPSGYGGDVSEAILDQIERFAPGARDRVVDRVATPPGELARHNANWVGGDIATGANTSWQLVARPRLSANPYSLGVPGMFVCSAATPPGGGVHGMCGANAADAALDQLVGRRSG